MGKLKILNLYACLGGNRKKWDEVANIEVTAVELDPELAKMYQDEFPNDNVVVADDTVTKAIYPDMMLYQEIIFLQHYYKGKYCVENVIPYYEPLIPAKKRGRHLYWTNFNLPANLGDRRFAISATRNELKGLEKFHNIDVSKYKGAQSKIKVCRNLVDYEAGKTILETAIGIIKKMDIKQSQLQF